MPLRQVLGLVSLVLLTTSHVSAQAAKQTRQAAATGEIAETKPEVVGFSSERLGKLDSSMQSLVDTKKLAGMVTVLARHGKIVEEKTYAYAHVASRETIQKEKIVSIY